MTFIPIRPNSPPLEGNVPPEFAKAVRQAVVDTCGHSWNEECNSHLTINIHLDFPGHDESFCRHGDKAIPWQDVSKRLQALGFVADKDLAILRWVSPTPILTQVEKNRGRKWFDWFRKVFKC